MNTLLVTYGDIIDAVVLQSKIDPNDENSVNEVKAAINRRNLLISSRKKWRWLIEDRRSLVMPATYTTGTVTFNANSRLVTGNGTNFRPDMVGWWFLPTGSNYSYRVVSYTNPNQIVVDSPNVQPTFAAGSGYNLYQAELGLFPDLEEINEVRVDGRQWVLKAIGPSDMNDMRKNNMLLTGCPRYYSMTTPVHFKSVPLGQFVLGFDFLGGRNLKVPAISLYPAIPDQQYLLRFMYKKKIKQLVKRSDVPAIPVEYRNILFFYTLSEWYQNNGQENKAAYYEQLGDRELKELESKYVDTDGPVQLRPRWRNNRLNPWYSNYWFDHQ